MPITTRWANEHKDVYFFDLHMGDWTWQQYDLAVDDVMDTVTSIDHDVAAIILSAARLPEGNAITHLLHVVRTQPPNLKLYIVVGGSPFIQTMNQIVMRMYPKLRIIFTTSQSEAVNLAAKYGFHAESDA